MAGGDIYLLAGILYLMQTEAEDFEDEKFPARYIDIPAKLGYDNAS